jgi:hypothetical protein
MPLNALQIVDQFKMKSNADRAGEQQAQLANQIRVDETLRTVRNRNVLGDVMKANPQDMGAAADQYLQQTGDGEMAMKLQDRAVAQSERTSKNAMGAMDLQLKGLDWISKTGKTVTKDTYGQWRDSAVQMGIAAAEDLPETFDQGVMDQITGAATAELKEVKINLPGRKQQQIFSRGGKEVYRGEPYEMDAPPAPTESWGETYTENGRTFQRSNRGKVSEVGGRSAQSGDMAIMDRLLQSGIAKDDRDAWDMLQGYKKNPQAGATQIARMEVQAQKDAGIMPGDENYKTPGQIYTDVRRSIAEMEDEGVQGEDWQPNPQDLRADGTQKGNGWQGPIKRPDGKVMSEISVGVNLEGKDLEIPLIVPTLTKQELDWLAKHDPQSPDFMKTLPKSIGDKAVAHARERMKAGQSPFKTEGQAAPPKKPKIGIVEDGYRYVGGDPANPKSWKQVAK